LRSASRQTPVQNISNISQNFFFSFY